MISEEELTKLLVQNEFILNGQITEEGIRNTVHFQLLSRLTKKPILTKSEVSEILGQDQIDLVLFALRGDGLVTQNGNNIRLSPEFQKLIKSQSVKL
jgi:hypothetical protein